MMSKEGIVFKWEQELELKSESYESWKNIGID